MLYMSRFSGSCRGPAVMHVDGDHESWSPRVHVFESGANGLRLKERAFFGVLTATSSNYTSKILSI